MNESKLNSLVNDLTNVACRQDVDPDDIKRLIVDAIKERRDVLIDMVRQMDTCPPWSGPWSETQDEIRRIEAQVDEANYIAREIEYD